MKCDMTKGSIRKNILFFSLPVFAGSVLQQLYNMADSILVGQFLGVNALAAVGATGSIFFLVIGCSDGFSRGLSICISKYVGMGSPDKIKRSIALSLVLSMVAGACLTLIGLFCARPLLQLLDVPEEIIGDALTYIRVIYGGVCITVMYNLLSNIARALGDSVTPLLSLTLSAVMNILLDYLFLKVWKCGVAGVAVATLLSQMISAVLCLVVCLCKYEEVRLSKRDFRYEGKEALLHIRQGFPMALQSSVISLGVMVVSRALNGFGTEAIAAYTAANRIDGVVNQGFSALGVSITTFCGQNTGAGQTERIRQGIRSSVKMMLVLTVTGAIFNLTMGKWLLTLFTNENHIWEMAGMHLTIISLFYPICGMLIIARNSLQGMGRVMIPMCSSFFELTARALSALLLSKIIGFAGVCAANPLAWILSLIVVYLACRFVLLLQKENRK